jgi:SpoVK/Ycf46/Vps4 family AAA+-type ATPase
MSITERLIRTRAAAASNSLDLDSESPEGREDCVRKDLARRLERICENLSRADFEALVMKMAREQLRGEGVTHSRLRPC